MSTFKVIGHLNPDTDSTCSPIVYAWYLKTYQNQDAQAYLAGEPNKEALYVLSKFGFEKPQIINSFSEGDQVVLVDTNNADELIPGIESAQIVEIVDHHKLFGNLSTNFPIKITMSPVACVATIIRDIIGQNTIPSNVAGLLLAGILSDTLKFTSPTTTAHDKDVAVELAQIAGINPDELANNMFEVKSDLTGMDADAVLHMDSKIFELGGKKLRISVLETTKPANALAMITNLKSKMIELKAEESLDGIMLYIVDIINSSSEVIASGEFEKNLISKAHNIPFDGETINLPGVVSRKKQIVPNIEKALQ